MAVDWIAIGEGVGLMALGVERVLAKRREKRKMTEYKLLANPERCREHAESIRVLQGDMGTLKTDVAVLKNTCSDMKEDVAEIKHRLG